MQNRVYFVNLIIMILSWSASSFCFYILGFYIKYIPGSMFVNVIITCIADAISSIFAGLIAMRYGTQATLFWSFALAAVSGVPLMLSTEPFAIMASMMTTKFGINICFTLCYIINAEYFPAVVCSRIFGICNIFSRVSTIMSPLIAEVTPPIPMVVYITVCLISTFASAFLTKSEEYQEAIAEMDDCISQQSGFVSRDDRYRSISGASFDGNRLDSLGVENPPVILEDDDAENEN